MNSECGFETFKITALKCKQKLFPNSVFLSGLLCEVV